MSQLHLNSLAVCHVHPKVLDLIDVDALIEEFVSKNETRAFIYMGSEESNQRTRPYFQIIALD